MRGFGEGKRVEKRGAEAGVLLASNTPCNTRATPFPTPLTTPVLHLLPTVVCLSSLSLVSLPLPLWNPSTSPPSTPSRNPRRRIPSHCPLPRPSMIPRTRGRRSLFPPPSRLPLTRAPPALALLPASRPLPSPIALPPPALAPMAAATTKAMTVRVRANSRSHPKTPTRRSVPRPKAPSSAFTPALLTPSTRRSSRTALHETGT